MDTFHAKYNKTLETIIKMAEMTHPLFDSAEKKKRVEEILRPLLDKMFEINIDDYSQSKIMSVPPLSQKEIYNMIDINDYLPLFKRFLNNSDFNTAEFDVLCENMTNYVSRILTKFDECNKYFAVGFYEVFDRLDTEDVQILLRKSFFKEVEAAKKEIHKSVNDALVEFFPMVDTDEKKLKMSEIIQPVLDMMYENDIESDIMINPAAYLVVFKRIFKNINRDYLDFNFHFYRVTNYINRVVVRFKQMKELERSMFYCSAGCCGDSLYVNMIHTIMEVENDDRFEKRLETIGNYLATSKVNPIPTTKTLNGLNFEKQVKNHQKDVERRNRKKSFTRKHRKDTGKIMTTGNQIKDELCH